jgi:branched-chain amino acid transport system substrate-binding protein
MAPDLPVIMPAKFKRVRKGVPGMKKWIGLLLVMLLLGTAIPLVGCAEEEVEKGDYVVGAIFSTTGGASDLGVPEERTVNMIVDQINEDGGINGHPLRVVFYNDESDSVKCVTLANKLIEDDNVLAIVGPTTSGNSMAIIETVTSAKVPLVSCAASIDIVTPIADRYWVFKTPQTEVQAIREIYRSLEAEGLTDIATLTSTSAFGAAGKKYLGSEKGSYGITIVEDEEFSDDDTSMIDQLTKIKGTAAQAVVCWGINKESAIIAQNMKTLGMTIPLFCSHGIANKAFIDQAGDAANGVIFPAGKLLVIDDVPASDPQKEVLTQYRDDYEAIHGQGTINTFGGHAYDALMMVVMALEEIEEGLGTAEARKAVRDQIEKISGFAGTGGVFTMSATDHLGMAAGSLALIEIKDEEWTWLQ